MFTSRLTLFNLLGFEIKVDATWVVLAVLVTWSLASQAFPSFFEGFPESTYWWMGVLGAVGLFISIILHELGHAVVARYYNIRIRDITLFIFGGVADMADEPPHAKSEFWMALGGPAVSVALAVLCIGTYAAVNPEDGPGPLLGVTLYLGWLNGVLAVFNMLPAFPLDGGRVARATLWWWKGNLRWATRITSSVGQGFGMVFIVLGLLSIFGQNFVGGLWWCLIGLFMRTASQMSYRQLLMRRVLEGEDLRRFMRSEPVTVPGHATVRDLVEHYIYKFHYKMYPVLEGGELIGCVTNRDVKEVPQEEWSQHTVKDIARPCDENNTVSPDADPMNVLSQMSRSGQARMMVVENGKLVGVIALKDLLQFLSMKIDLEGGEEEKG